MTGRGQVVRARGGFPVGYPRRTLSSACHHTGGRAHMYFKPESVSRKEPGAFPEQALHSNRLGHQQGSAQSSVQNYRAPGAYRKQGISVRV